MVNPLLDKGFDKLFFLKKSLHKLQLLNENYSINICFLSIGIR